MLIIYALMEKPIVLCQNAHVFRRPSQFPVQRAPRNPVTKPTAEPTSLLPHRIEHGLDHDGAVVLDRCLLLLLLLLLLSVLCPSVCHFAPFIPQSAYFRYMGGQKIESFGVKIEDGSPPPPKYTFFGIRDICRFDPYFNRILMKSGDN